MKKQLLLAVFAVLALTACDQKQSYLELDGKDVAVATITGKVTYNPGGQNAQMIAADSVEVRAIVKNNQYSSGAQGNMIIDPVRTNKDGVYSITIPVGQVTISGVQVQVVPFESTYTDPNSGSKQTVYYTSDALPAAGVSLKAGEVKNVDIEMKPEFTLKDYVSSVKISGKVSYNAGLQQVSGGYEKALKPYANMTLKVKGFYGSNEINMQDVTTDAEGAYEFEVPAGETSASVQISTERFDGEYTYEQNGEYKTISVYYASSNHTVFFTQSAVELRNEDFAIYTYNTATDETKDFTIKSIKATVYTSGEVYDADAIQDEEYMKYKIDDVFLPFNVKLTLTSPDYDASNYGSPIYGNELIFTAKASTKDGSVEWKNLKVYSEWEGYNVTAKITVEDLVQTMPHVYYEFSGFNNAKYKTKTWANWHKDGSLSEPLVASFWSDCWPSTKKTQQIEGYYEYTGGTYSVTIDEKTLRYYGEYEFQTKLFMTFNVRTPKSIMGMWSNTNYNTQNEEDELGNYSPYQVTDEAVDADGVKLTSSTSKSSVLTHNKYIGVCQTYWKGLFYSLW